MTEEDAANVQAHSLGHATKDLYEAVARGDYPPEWELLVQMMDDHDHPELDFDPLDDTKTWPEQDFPPRPVGRMVLDRMPENFFAENEQISFGTGVLVDGLDFSDDKMLVGRTFSYSDTQRYRVGPNYLQLPVNQPKNAWVHTNQRDGQMTYYVDGAGGRTRSSTTSRRSRAVCARPSTRRTTSRARRSVAGSPASASRAPTTTSRPASATC